MSPPPQRTDGPRLSPLEIASDVVLGRSADTPSLPAPATSTMAALEECVLRGLARPPCLVSFSGGRDSSAILAVATRLARREGLPLPVPATTRFPGIFTADEFDWQETVVEHLGLDDWIRPEFDDELDLVGPVAARGLEQHGLLFPSNLHLHVPLLAAAGGGSLLTGVGGDELFTAGTRVQRLLTGRVTPKPRDLLRLGLAAMPRPVRAATIARRRQLPLAWLTAEARSRVRTAWGADEARYPRRLGPALREWWRSKYLHLFFESATILAADADVHLVHPFAEPLVVATVAASTGTRGFGGRTSAMRATFGDLLPDRVNARRTKASFDAVLWHRHSRRFAGELLEEGLFETLQAIEVDEFVDPGVLRLLWSSPSPPANTFLLLQACWLAGRGLPIARTGRGAAADPTPNYSR